MTSKSFDSEALEGRLSTGYPTDSWAIKEIRVICEICGLKNLFGSDRTATRKNAKKRYDLQGLGQNQSLTFHYDNA